MPPELRMMTSEEPPARMPDAMPVRERRPPMDRPTVRRAPAEKVAEDHLRHGPEHLPHRPPPVNRNEFGSPQRGARPRQRSPAAAPQPQPRQRPQQKAAR